MIKILFIHPNFPGQFKHILPALRRDGGYQIAYICRHRTIKDGEGIQLLQYAFKKEDCDSVHPHLHYTNHAIQETQRVNACLHELQQQNFIPDVVVGHNAWGGLLFIKDIFPDAKVIAYCELYFRTSLVSGTSQNNKANFEQNAIKRARNMHTLLQMESMDIGVTPTQWQLDSHPEIIRNKLVTVHEGVDTNLCAPDPTARFPVKEKGLYFSRDDTVITYVSRGFEPPRGFFQYMQALEMLCKELPQAHFLLVGGEKAFYSGNPTGTTYKQQALEKYKLDHDRVHFTGRLTHEGFRKVIQISSAHVYLTQPLFLSWSAVEAMSMAAPMIASDQTLVREFIEHEKDGLLVDYYNPRQIADGVKRLVADKSLAAKLGQHARQKIVDNYDISQTVQQWLQVIKSVT